jgi:thioredoxin reductase (NADPH)
MALSVPALVHPVAKLSAFQRAAAQINAIALNLAAPTAPSSFSSAANTSSYSSGTTATNASKPHPVVIIGSGPAGHTAAIYLARANLNPVMYEGFMAGGVAAGGQLTTTTEVENCTLSTNWQTLFTEILISVILHPDPGFPKGLSGPEMMEAFREQSIRFGTVVHTETISRVDLSSRPFKLWIENQEDKPPITASSLVIATGATAKRMFLLGEETYWQAGISACAVCDGALPVFRNKSVAVVGGGDSACEEASFLTKYVSKVFMLVRRDKLRASKIMADRILKNPKIELLWNTVPIEAKGDGKLLQSLIVEDTETRARKELGVNGLFYAIGHVPNTGMLAIGGGKGGMTPQIELDADGYVKVKPGTSFTNVEGVFAAGDVQDKRYRQAVTAAGSGCMAALDCEKFLSAEGIDKI